MASSSVDNLDSSVSVVNSSGENEKLSSNNSDEQYRKLFIGGLNYTTTDEKLKEYCSQFGEISECSIMRDRENRSRGFAFVTFKDRAIVDQFMANRPHTIDNRQIEPKRAMPRDEASKSEGQLTVKKIFIGGVKEDITDDDLKNYFGKFGNILECKIMKDKEDKFRGFAFITFDDYDSVDRCILEKPHLIKTKELDVRKAIPREQTSRSNHFLLTNPANFHPDLYSTHFMFNPSALSPYPYFPAKPLPLMGTTGPAPTLTTTTTNGNILSPQAYFFPTDQFLRNQTYPSPPPSISSTTQNKTKSVNEQNHDATKHSTVTPLRTKTRTNSTNASNSEQHRKLFIGGLSLKTTDESLKDYVTKYGEVSDSLVMKDQNGQSRCFGFVTFTNPDTIDEFMKQRPHTLDGRQIDPKRAMPREEANNDEVHLTVKKIFIGGIRDGLNEENLKEYFTKFGHINDCFLMYDKDGKTRGFAFLEFDDFDSVDKVILTRPHIIGEYRIDVKKAVPKGQRQIHLLHQQQQQHQQIQQQHQQQYALQQMQAATAYQFYYSHQHPPAFNLLTNGNCTLPLISSNLSTGTNGANLDEIYSTTNDNNNNNNINNNPTSNSLRYIPTRNNRRQSLRGSQ